MRGGGLVSCVASSAPSAGSEKVICSSGCPQNQKSFCMQAESDQPLDLSWSLGQFSARLSEAVDCQVTGA